MQKIEFTTSTNGRESALPYKSRCHHHFLESKEVGVFLQDDGLDLMVPGPTFNKWTDCGHVDFPIDIQETVESNLKEKRTYPNPPAKFFINTFTIS